MRCTLCHRACLPQRCQRCPHSHPQAGRQGLVAVCTGKPGSDWGARRTRNRLFALCAPRGTWSLGGLPLCVELLSRGIKYPRVMYKEGEPMAGLQGIYESAAEEKIAEVGRAVRPGEGAGARSGDGALSLLCAAQRRGGSWGAVGRGPVRRSCARASVSQPRFSNWGGAERARACGGYRQQQ